MIYTNIISVEMEGKQICMMTSSEQYDRMEKHAIEYYCHICKSFLMNETSATASYTMCMYHVYGEKDPPSHVYVKRISDRICWIPTLITFHGYCSLKNNYSSVSKLHDCIVSYVAFLLYSTSMHILIILPSHRPSCIVTYMNNCFPCCNLNNI